VNVGKSVGLDEGEEVGKTLGCCDNVGVDDGIALGVTVHDPQGIRQLVGQLLTKSYTSTSLNPIPLKLAHVRLCAAISTQLKLILLSYVGSSSQISPSLR